MSQSSSDMPHVVRLSVNLFVLKLWWHVFTSVHQENYLKTLKSSQTRCTYFKPEGASSTLYSARFKANLTDLSDCPLKDHHLSHHLWERHRESTALQSHLLWLSDLLMALTRKLEQPSCRPTNQPILTKVLEHQKWSNGPANRLPYHIGPQMLS